MVTIVTSVNTTSQNTIDGISSDINSRNLVENYDNWLVYHIHEIEFTFELDDLVDNDVDINIFTKYVRFASRFSKYRNQVFVLLTDTYEETPTAIQSSGFGTSSTVIFMVMITKGFQTSKYLLKPFEQGLPEIEEDKNPFNAVLVFIEARHAKQTKVGILCHTCLGSKIRYFETTIQRDDFKFLEKLSNQLNNNGNTRKVAFRGPMPSMDDEMEICFNSLD